MAIDLNGYRKKKKNEFLDDLFLNEFMPPIYESIGDKDINTKLYCAARLLHHTAEGIFTLNVMGYNEEKLKEEKKEYLLLLKELAEVVRDV